MKKIILFCLILSATIVHAQEQTTITPLPTLLTYKTYGYVNGVRLDSIDAQYATFSWKNSNTLSFDFGQFVPSKKLMAVTDNKTVPLYFQTQDDMLVLNFLYYNGWELDQANAIAPNASNYVLKKRNK